MSARLDRTGIAKPTKAQRAQFERWMCVIPEPAGRFPVTLIVVGSFTFGRRHALWFVSWGYQFPMGDVPQRRRPQGARFWPVDNDGNKLSFSKGAPALGRRG